MHKSHLQIPLRNAVGTEPDPPIFGVSNVSSTEGTTSVSSGGVLQVAHNTKQVKLGLYGCGNRTRTLLESLEGEGAFEVVSAYDLRPDAARTLCERFGGTACDSAGAMLATPGIEAVMISLDPFAHVEAFIETLELGVPIFLEKPIAPTAREAHRMFQAAQARGVPVQVGLLYRYYPAYQAVKRHLADHDPGRVLSMVYNWQHAGETERINMRNRSPDNFRLKISQIPFHCCHALDLYRVFIGDIAAVTARGIKQLHADYPSPDEVIAILEFANGAIGHFHYSSVCQGWETAYPIHINTENYALTCNHKGYVGYYRPPSRTMRGELSMEDCRPEWNRHKGPVQHRFDLDHFKRATAEIMMDFLTAVRAGTPMPVPLEDGYRVAELADAIEQSWQTGQTVALPLAF